MSIADILNEVKKLSPDERLQVLEALQKSENQRLLDEKRAELHRRLIAQGLLKAIPPRRDVSRSKPVSVSGEPLSQTIIEERG